MLDHGPVGSNPRNAERIWSASPGSMMPPSGVSVRPACPRTFRLAFRCARRCAFAVLHLVDFMAGIVTIGAHRRLIGDCTGTHQVRTQGLHDDEPRRERGE